MDIDELRKLMEFMNENGLTELEVEEKDSKVRLVKGGGVSREVHAVPTYIPSVGVQAGIPAAAGAAAEVPEESVSNRREITAPMVGTFYRAPSPESDPFVDVGVDVTEESTVCIIEAMKVMNEIQADVAGKIIEVLVENGQPVEYGQPLFVVELEE